MKIDREEPGTLGDQIRDAKDEMLKEVNHLVNTFQQDYGVRVAWHVSPKGLASHLIID